jgi:hypothetical protein
MAASPLHKAYSAVWTGTKMFVYGGTEAAEYDPAADNWTSVDTAHSGLGARFDVAATVSPAGGAVVWGGEDTSAWYADGATYVDGTGWAPLRAPTSAEFANAARHGAFSWWRGGELWIFGGSWGGYHGASDGAHYDPALDKWTAFPASFTGERAPMTRVWSGTELLVWSVSDGAGATTNDGAVYRP